MKYGLMCSAHAGDCQMLDLRIEIVYTGIGASQRKAILFKCLTLRAVAIEVAKQVNEFLGYKAN